MISTRRKHFIIAAVVIVSLWGVILGFADPFGCAWPDLDELIRGQTKFPTSSIAIDLRHPCLTRFEETIVSKVVA